MNFDIILIGGGLSALTCGIALQQQGKKCAIINNGQSALDFSSGSFDLLSDLPQTGEITNIEQAYELLQQQVPSHPYCLFGKQTVIAKAQQFEQLAKNIGLELVGSYERNHQRITPLGSIKASWLSPTTLPCLNLEGQFEYNKIAVLGIEGYQDFQPELLAENLAQHPAFKNVAIRSHFLTIPALDNIRTKGREFRSVHLSQVLQHDEFLKQMANEIQQNTQTDEAVFLPACLGLENAKGFQDLIAACERQLFELPTLPPSVLGMRQHHQLKTHFEQLGGFIFNGAKVIKADIEQQQVKQVYTSLHGDEAITAQHFVLATGNFFSQGLVADFDHIYEPIFNADILSVGDFSPTNRLTWTNSRFAAPQPYQQAGVVINQKCQVQCQGQIIENLFAIGNVLGGFNAIELGCGSGVAIISALTAADSILEG